MARRDQRLNQDMPHPDEGSGAEAANSILMPRRRMGVLGWCSASLVGLIVLALAGAGIFAWTLHKDRNSGFLRQQLLTALAQGLGEGHAVSVASAGLQFAGLTSTFSVAGLAIANPATGAKADLAEAEVEVSTFSLWRQRPEARVVRMKGLKLVVPAARASDQPLAANEALALFRAILAGAHFAGTGQDPTFRTIEQILGTDIAIFQQDADGRVVAVQSGLSIDIRRLDDGRLTATLGKAGQPAALMLKAQNRPLADGGSMMLLDSEAVDMKALSSLFTAELPGLDPNMRVRMSFHSRVAADGRLIEKGARLDMMDGVVTPPDPEIKPFRLDQASLELRMRADSPDILLDRVRVRFNETDIQLSGRLEPQPGDRAGVKVTLHTERADIDRLSPSETPISLDSVVLEGMLAPNLRSFRIDRLQVREDGGHATLSGQLSAENDGLIEIRLAVENLDLRKALRIWPIWVAPTPRIWLVDHAEAGVLANLQVDLRLAGQALRDSMSHQPIPDDALAVTFRLANTTMRPLRDAAPLLNLNGQGRVTGRRAEAVIESAVVEPVPGQRFSLRDGRLQVPNTTISPAIMEMALPAEGRLGALMTFLAAPSLRDVSGLPPDATVAEGQFQGQANVILPMGRLVSNRDIKVEFRADLRQVAIDNMIKNERLEAGTFTLLSRNGALTVQGDARLFGVTSQIELKSEPGRPGVVIAKASVDETVLARRGVDLRPALQGPLQMTVGLPLARNATGVDVEIDLARARVETGIPGIAKRAGQPGRVKFTVVTRADGTVLDNLDLELAPASLRGKVELGRDGQFSKADFSTFKLSGGDNARLQAERQRGVMRLVLRGNAFDLRPFLRGFQAGKIEDGRPAEAKPPDFDLDLQTTVLIGFNGELMGGVETRMARRAGRVTQIALKGQFGAAPVMASSSESQRDTISVNATAQDGGALLRFLDIYNKAYGGRLSAEILVGAQTQQGVVQMRDFMIRGESALRQVGASGRGISATQNLGDDVMFTKMRADFARRPGRLELREAVMWGNQLGGTIEGTLDYAADRVDLKGVFVPAYALNNFFASVPLLGPILGGAQYEGLFAVPFVISGRASAPVMRINPVSAIAPGFLRKLFEIQREGGGNAPALNRAN
jgi:hypothetical protein